MPIGYCAYTGQAIETMKDGVWDDDEWISWNYINQLRESSDPKPSRPPVNQELRDIFESLKHIASAYKDHTGRYLNIFGELGELYAEVELGLRRHRLNAPGSDGRVGNDFVEVKTISPLKQDDKVRVKRNGNFNKLYIVRISENFFFEGRMIDRLDLKKSSGKFASVKFKDLESEE